MKTISSKTEYTVVPPSVVKRLPRYYRFLRELIQEDNMRISSSLLAEKMGVTASQIRQDLSCFGAFGHQGYGYSVKYLYGKIGEILGLGDDFSAIIVGDGELGRYISREPIFSKYGVALRCVLPADVGKISGYCSKNEVDIAVLALPPEENRTDEIVAVLEESGIRGIWNLSGRELASEKIKIMNINLSDSLMTLCYMMKKEATDEG